MFVDGLGVAPGRHCPHRTQVPHRSCNWVVVNGVLVIQKSTSPKFAHRKIQTHQRIRDLTLAIMGPSKVDSALKKYVFGTLRKPSKPYKIVVF